MATSSQLSQPSIARFFASLPDPRRRQTRITHPLLTLVVIALCGTIAGADNWEEIEQFARDRRDWLGRFVDLSNGIPSHDTFSRVFAALNPVAFQKCLLAWIQWLHEITGGQIIAVDGKLARGAMACGGEQGPLTLVSAWATENHVFLGQVAGEAGSNELGALPKLLELLELNGAIVTMDALGCQKAIVAQIVEQKGDYVIAVKGNQEKLEAAVHAAAAAAFETDAAMPTITRVEHLHGRKERRDYVALAVPPDFPDLDQWKGMTSILIACRTHVDAAGVEHKGTRYYISSLPPKVTRLAEAVRSHWAIENEMHWVLDMAFNEDRSRAQSEHSQANLGVLRRAALSLLKNTENLKGSIHCRRQQAAWNNQTLEKILFGSSS